MNDQNEDQVPAAIPEEDDVSAAPTGREAIDAVLRSLDDLADRPVEEHVAVFESAHETLRAALADASDQAGAPSGR